VAPKKGRKLTARQRKFAEVYAGNGTEAARAAGYRGSNKALGVTASKLLAQPIISALIKERETKEVRPLVASRVDRQEFWTRTMNDEGADMFARLKASELLGKSEADFTDKHQLDDKNGEPISFSINIGAK
jgi:phage terminase small subunit